jgi:hypothetical protein
MVGQVNSVHVKDAGPACRFFERSGLTDSAELPDG